MHIISLLHKSQPYKQISWLDAFNGDGFLSAGTVQKSSNPGRNDGAENQGKAFLKTALFKACHIAKCIY